MPSDDLQLSDCYHAQGQRQFDRRSVEGLLKSLNHCHAVNQVLIRENGKLQEKLTRQWVYIKALSWGLGLTCGIVAALVAFIVTNW